MKTLLAIFVGGGTGSLLRYGIGRLIFSSNSGLFPIGTLVANVLSCSILALVLFGLSKAPDLSYDWKAFMVIGFCGGLSTFSAFSVESLQLLKEGNWEMSLLNIGTSIGLCLFIIYLFAGRAL